MHTPTHTHTHTLTKYVILNVAFPRQKIFANALHCYFVRTLPVVLSCMAARSVAIAVEWSHHTLIFASASVLTAFNSFAVSVHMSFFLFISVTPIRDVPQYFFISKLVKESTYHFFDALHWYTKLMLQLQHANFLVSVWNEVLCYW